MFIHITYPKKTVIWNRWSCHNITNYYNIIYWMSKGSKSDLLLLRGSKKCLSVHECDLDKNLTLGLILTKISKQVFGCKIWINFVSGQNHLKRFKMGIFKEQRYWMACYFLKEIKPKKSGKKLHTFFYTPIVAVFNLRFTFN